MKLRLAKKIQRWCDPSLADMDGQDAFDLEALAARGARYRPRTRARAHQVVRRWKRRGPRFASGPLVAAFREIAAAAEAGRPSLPYLVYRTMLTVPPRRHFVGMLP